MKWNNKKKVQSLGSNTSLKVIKKHVKTIEMDIKIFLRHCVYIYLEHEEQILEV